MLESASLLARPAPRPTERNPCERIGARPAAQNSRSRAQEARACTIPPGGPIPAEPATSSGGCADSRRAYRRFRHGPGVFKLDVALDGPIPWANASCRLAGTVHVGGTYEEITAAERAVAAGEHPERPFVISSQPLVADPGRAPQGTHVLWAYCHVPARSRLNMTDRIFDQFERFAPGFRDRVVAVSARGPTELEADNANLVGGDITGGALSVRGLMARPSLFRPYKAGRGAFICSSSTPPGAGVHGMCGWHAARAVLRDMR